jgi:hypothetical protein
MLVRQPTLGARIWRAFQRRRELLMATDFQGLSVYGAEDDKQTLETVEFLFRNGVPHHWMNIAEEENATRIREIAGDDLRYRSPPMPRLRRERGDSSRRETNQNWKELLSCRHSTFRSCCHWSRLPESDLRSRQARCLCPRTGYRLRTTVATSPTRHRAISIPSNPSAGAPRQPAARFRNAPQLRDRYLYWTSGASQKSRI